MFYIAQFFGLIAAIFLITSFQINDRKKLLKLQIVSSLFFALQYLFLKAYSGLLMSIIVIFRNYIFQDKISTKKIIFMVILMFVGSFFTFDGIISLLPVIACIEYTIALGQPKLKILRFAELISSALYLIYDIFIIAIAGVISTTFEFIFAIIAVYRFDIKKCKK